MSKKITVEFAPGCFDNFEGTQEELDQLVAEIYEKFSNMTPEELEMSAVPIEGLDITEEELEDMLDNLEISERLLN
jgi:DNA phosphorothioation-dependent restriction protein DptG